MVYKRKIVSHSPSDTEKIGMIFGKKIKTPYTLLLFGDLGTGKTVFVRGFVKGTGSSDRVKSPSFTILYIYGNGKLPIYHFDLYRLTEDDVRELIEEGYFDREGISIVEWGERFPLHYLDSFLKIEFYLIGEKEREIVFSVYEKDEELKRLIDEVVDEYNRD